MKEENYRQDNLKIIFSLISLFLMIPPLINGDNNYYRTLFIFLINRVIYMSFKSKSNESLLFVIWSLINQWSGVLVCAVAFCSIDPDFAEVCKSYANLTNIILFVSAISCVLKELLELIVVSVEENLIEKKIKRDVNEMKGESL